MAMAAHGSGIIEAELALAQTRLAMPSPTGGASEEAKGSAAIFTDTEDGELVQRRLALLYRIFALVVFGFFVLITAYSAIAMSSRFWELQRSPSKAAHAAGLVVLVCAWLICRGRPRSARVLAATELTAALGLTTAASFVVAYAARGFTAEFMGVLVFILSVTLRAALVPSRPRWTAFVAAVAAVPVPIGAYVSALHNLRWHESLVPRSLVLVLSLGWCIAGIVTTFAISRIVYGLRAEVKIAMRLGQYTLDEKIGEGGMGTVYRAHHALLQRPTALKLLLPDRVGLASVKRFEREVQLTSKLTHPNTIAIYDYGHTQAGVFFYAMELIDGLSLEELCEEYGPQPAARVVHILTQVASALAEAHDVGLIHRDIKPANILLSERGGLPDFAKVLDFGLVKEVGSADAKLSGTAAIMGTPTYVAPETIAHPDAITASVDLYSLGGVAYWLLTGAPPFHGANVVEVLHDHLHSQPLAPSKRTRNHVPAALDALVLKCLEKRPEARPPSARALVRELRAIQDDCPWDEEAARRWWRARGDDSVRTRADQEVQRAG
jgi:hypothetical protein